MRVPTALIGCRVHRTSFDWQVRLGFADPDPGVRRRVDAELVVETGFRWRDAGGVWHDLEPGTRGRLAPVLEVFERAVHTVDVRGPGTLHLIFDDRSEMCVPPHPHYESWHLSGTGVDGITVGPGGEAAWER